MMTCHKTTNGYIYTNEDKDIPVGEYQIPSRIVSDYKAGLLDGKRSCRQKFYQRIAKYAPRDVLRVRHKWKNGCCQYYALELLDELREYQVYHNVNHVTTVQMNNVTRLLEEYGYLEG